MATLNGFTSHAAPAFYRARARAPGHFVFMWSHYGEAQLCGVGRGKAWPGVAMRGEVLFTFNNGDITWQSKRLLSTLWACRPF